MRVSVVLMALAMLIAPIGAFTAGGGRPGEVMQVTAEGEAVAGEPDARERAIGDALRNAVMGAVGTYIDATTVGANYQVVEDQIFMKAAGFATLDRVESTSVKEGVLRVRVRASVSSVPLAKRLKELGVTHQWKVGVHVTSRPDFVTDAAAAGQITDQLLRAGFRVIDGPQGKRLEQNEAARRAARGDRAALAAVKREFGVDILVVGEAVAENIDHMVQGGVTFYRTRGSIGARAYYTDTGEVLTIADSEAESLGQTRNLAAKASLKKAGAKAGAALATDLMIAPAALTPFMTVKVANLRAMPAVSEFESALRMMPGVTQVKRQRYTDGVLELSVYVKSEFRDALPAKITSSAAGRKLGIEIDAWSKTFVQARAE